jgi:hypothetical protein
MLLARAPDLCSPMKGAACMKLPYALFGILSLTLTFTALLIDVICMTGSNWEIKGKNGKPAPYLVLRPLPKQHLVPKSQHFPLWLGQTPQPGPICCDRLARDDSPVIVRALSVQEVFARLSPTS